MPESYVRPVTGAREPRSERAATWRFRAVGLVLLAAGAAGIIAFVQYTSGAFQGGQGGTLDQPTPSATASP